MATIKSYTDISQSKKLAEMLPLESADSHYVRQTHDFRGNTVDGKWSHPKYGNPNSRYANYIIQNFSSYETIPCWSLAALFSVLPDEVKDNHYLTLDKEGEEYCCCYEDCNGNSFKHYFSNNPVDACVAMIEKLHELKML